MGIEGAWCRQAEAAFICVPKDLRSCRNSSTSFIPCSSFDSFVLWLRPWRAVSDGRSNSEKALPAASALHTASDKVEDKDSNLKL